MAKQQNWVLIGLVVLVGAFAFGFIQLPTASVQTSTTPQAGTPQVTTLTGNPALVVTVLDAKTQSVLNEATVRLLDSSGQLRATGNTTNGVVTLSNLDPSFTYTAEVLPISGTSAFYAFSAPLASNSAGSKTVVLTYNSESTTAPTVTIYNNDDLTANSATAAQAIGLNESVTFRFRVRPAASSNDNNRFSDGALAPLFAINYVPTHLQQLSMKEGTVAMGTGTSPTGFSAYGSDSNNNRSGSAFFVGNTKVLLPATNYDYYLTVKGDASTQPVALTGASSSDTEIHVYMYDSCRVQNSQLGTYGEYYTNPIGGADLCGANADFNAHYS